jgi:hypothetical protein
MNLMFSRVLLVFGWYGRGNFGDELMKQALVALFGPRGIDLRFVDRIDVPDLQRCAGVVFGGGSILYDDPDVTSDALAMLLARQVPVFYVGVGGEAGPSPMHQKLIDVAAVVAFRELDVPDLAYSLADGLALETDPGPKGLLFVPNVEVLPTYADAHWMHVAWEHFKNEVAQFFDRCIDRGTPVSFLLMCSGEQKDDAWPTAELLGRMKRRAPRPEVYLASVQGVVADDVRSATVNLLRAHAVVFTQRYHGIVLAEMAGVPYVSIDHHDKLRLANPHRGGHLSYHGAQKDAMTDVLETSLASEIRPYRVPRKVYDDLVDKIVRVVEGRNDQGAQQVRRSP